MTTADEIKMQQAVTRFVEGAKKRRERPGQSVFPGRTPTDDEYVAAYIELIAERVGEMESIVDRLPRTRDGVPVVLGQEVFGIDEFGGGVLRGEAFIGFSDGAVQAKFTVCVAGDTHNVAQLPVEDCYSTRESAEAAR